jgi:quinoprotein glucose dehydrogenase
MLRTVRRRLIVPACLTSLLGAALGLAVSSPAAPQPPRPTAAAVKLVDQGAYDPRLRGYLTPPGFKVQIVADYPAVVNPAIMTFGEDGTLFVAEWLPGEGADDRIKVLRSTKGDGVFDQSTTLLDDVHLPSGLLAHEGWLYVTEDDHLWRMRLEGGRPQRSTKQVLVKGFKDDKLHHRLSGIALGPEGSLYLTTGDSDADARGSDRSRVELLRHGGVFRCRPDGSRLELVASGMRNPFGNIAFDRTFEILHTDNDNEDGSKFQGCRLLHVVEQGDYGWRLEPGAICCRPDHARATWFGERPGRLGRLLDTGRGAPTGLAIINSPAFPDEYQNVLIHPDVFRALVRLYKLEPAGGTFRVAQEIPFLQAKGPDEGMFRPSDAEMGPDGALYVLDWRTFSGGSARMFGDGRNGRILRITWAGTGDLPARPTKPFNTWSRLRGLSTDELVGIIAGPDFWERTYAHRELARRLGEAREKLRALTLDKTRPATARLHALLALAHDFGPREQEICLELLARAADDDVALVARALDLLARLGRPNTRLRAPALATLPPPVLRRAAMVYGKLRPPGALDLLLAPAVLRAVADDPLAADGVHRGLDGLGGSAARALARLATEKDPVLRKVALHALIGMRHPAGVEQATRLSVSPGLSDAERIELMVALRTRAAPGAPARLARWLAAQRNAAAPVQVAAIEALDAIGEQRRDETRRAVRPFVPRLLRAPEAELQKAALRLAGRLEVPGTLVPIIELGKDQKVAAEVRVLAVRALGSHAEPRSRQALAELMRSSDSEDVSAEALKSLALVAPAEATPRALEWMGSSSARLRRDAISVLSRTPQTARRLAERAAAGQVQPEDLPVLLSAVARLKDPEITATLGELFKAQGGQSQGVAALVQAVRKSGDPTRGQSLFLQQDKLGCILCHEIEGVGGQVGPSLTRIYETMTLEKIIEAIMEPSKEIKEAYSAYDVQLVDGRVLSGRLASQTPDRVVLQDGSGNDIALDRKSIARLVKSDVSLMPEGTTAHLTVRELADLLAFLKSKEAQEKLRNR